MRFAGNVLWIASVAAAACAAVPTGSLEEEQAGDEGDPDPPGPFAGPCVIETFRADGTLRARTEFAWDGSGRKVGTSYDFDGNGAVDAEETWRYNSADQVTEFAIDRSDGTYWRRVFAYDARGNEVLETDERSDGEAGVRIFHVHSHYNDDDDLLMAEWEEDGLIAPRIEHAYAGGLHVETTWDYDGDGEIDDRGDYRYDDSERLIYRGHDAGDDGITDHWLTYSYDHSGNRILEESYNAGELSGRSRYWFDEEGRLVERTLEDHANGTDPYRNLYTYNSRGWLIREEWVHVDTRQDHTYDESGNVVLTVWTTEGTVLSRLLHDYSCFAPRIE
jgi:antitoxin component YwqK of YwqJK toxin-antitoxin module